MDLIKIFFEPKSIAVVGASRKVMKAGHIIFKNLVENKKRGLFKGELYPINPNEDYILGYKCYKSILEVPGELESIIIAVPAKIVPSIMEEAVKKRVKVATIISAGFSEVGNKELEDEVKKIAEKAGIRVLGPNCLGVYDSYSGVDMLFLPETKVLSSGEEVVATPRPLPGSISIVSQSGAFGIAALDYLTGKQLGVSKFVSFGNKMDVDESEMLLYLLNDEKTKIILLYVESIEDGRKFMKVAESVTKGKPIVALKSGRTKAGARAAASHTAALSGVDEVYEAVFKQVGILRAQNMEEFFDIGKALMFQPPANGNNVGIITDAGGPGILAVDECELNGVNVKKFSEKTYKKLNSLKEKGIIPEFASLENPIDLTGIATSEMFEEVTKILFEADEINGIILISLHHVPALQEDFIDKICKISKNYLKPIVACDIGETEMALYIRTRFEKEGIPAYSSPEDAAKAMIALIKYGVYLKKKGYLKDYLRNFLKKRSI
ncbi:MAG: CoA-binding protein [Candidatus Bathyarchaeia archaeon]